MKKIFQTLRRLFAGKQPVPPAPRPLPAYLARHEAAQAAGHFTPYHANK